MKINLKLSTLTSSALLAISFNVAFSHSAIADTSASEPVSSEMIVDKNQSKQHTQSTAVKKIINPEEVTPASEDWSWIDESREDTKHLLTDWANKMNSWFGETDPNDPATASLRIIMDTRWVDDPVEGNDVTVEPRIRGRLKLPVLEDKLSLVIGDDELDDESVLRQNSSGSDYYRETSANNKTIDRKKAREDNASIALRWSQIEEQLGLDADIGVRSGDDVYVKISVDKDLYEQDQIKVSNDSFYRYGIDSEHYARTGFDFRIGNNPNRFINNRTTLHYANKDSNERVYWNNDLRQFHHFDNHKQLSYGISANGDFKGDNKKLNSYGTTISYRQPIWRDWLYIQTELNYFNDKKADKEHYPSALLRMEALF